MGETERQKMLEKIRKLMALAENNSSEAQATAAAEKAQELMIRYKLSEFDLAEAGAELSVNSDIIKKRVELSRSDGIRWRQLLWNSVAKHFFTKAIVTSDNNGLWIVGTDHDVDITIAIASSLEVQAVTAMLISQLQRDKNSSTNLKTWKNSFYHGFVSAIHQRLKERRAEAERQEIQGSKITALAVRSDSAIAEFVDYEFGKLRNQSASRVRFDPHANQLGRTAGRNAQIDRPLSTGFKKLGSG